MKEKGYEILILSDMNATTEVTKSRTYFGKQGTIVSPHENTNDNGLRLESFAVNNNLCLSSTFFEHEKEDRFTWFSNDGKTKKILDHILASQTLQKQMIDCKVQKKTKLPFRS